MPIMKKFSVSPMTTTVRRVKRSASTPPQPERSNIGSMATAWIAVTWNGSPVSRCSNHPRAVRTMKKEMKDMSEAAHNIRNGV